MNARNFSFKYSFIGEIIVVVIFLVWLPTSSSFQDLNCRREATGANCLYEETWFFGAMLRVQQTFRDVRGIAVTPVPNSFNSNIAIGTSAIPINLRSVWHADAENLQSSFGAWRAGESTEPFQFRISHFGNFLGSLMLLLIAFYVEPMFRRSALEDGIYPWENLRERQRELDDD